MAFFSVAHLRYVAYLALCACGYGAKKEARLNNGNAPLAEACHRGHFEVVEMLVEAGCNVDAVSHLQISPLMAASAANEHNLVKMLIKRWADKGFKDVGGATAVYYAAIRRHVESLKLLLEAGANPNCITIEGSPLGQTAAQGHYECAKLLLEHGADINAYQTNGSNFTALGEAAYHGRNRIIELLLDHGANIENCCPKGFSALSTAARNGQNAAISLLADRGAEIDRRGFGNLDPDLDITPLMRAAIRGFDSSVGLLLDLGADVNAKDVHGTTALYYATKNRRSDVVGVLIHSRANVNAETTGSTLGTTALMVAAGLGYVEIARQLLEANANTRLRDWRGCTAWIMAVNSNHDREMAHLLKPAPDEQETLHRLQADRPPSEIAAYMNEVYP
jgi:ankyrin repeat protein